MVLDTVRDVAVDVRAVAASVGAVVGTTWSVEASMWTIAVPMWDVVYVGCYSLCVNCLRIHAGYCVLCVGCYRRLVSFTASMQDVTSSMWAIILHVGSYSLYS